MTVVTRLIYVGAPPAVTLAPLPGVVFERHGDPVAVPNHLAEELTARGDFIEFVPEPPARPVQKSKQKTKE